MKRKYVILLIILAIIIIVGILTYMFLCKPKTPTPNQNNGMQTYRSSQYGFSIGYPQDYNFYNGEDPHYTVGEFFVGVGKPIVTIELPKNSYPDTNYYDSFLVLSVAIKDVPDLSVENCNKAQRQGDTEIVELSDTKTINGQVFYRGEADGAAAGTLVKTRIYHSAYNNSCYEATLNIVEGNIDNFPQGTVHQFDEQDVWNKLEAVLGTISFNSTY